MTKSLPIALLLAAIACRGDGERKPASATPEGAQPAPAPATADASGIHWIEDDYAGAIAAARRAGTPVLIDMWAEWCHTCLSMKHTVLADPGLAPLADRFVWLSIDTEKESNAPVLAQFPVNTWPTFFVVSPPDESVQARYVGSASVAQFRDFLTEGERGHLDALAKGGGLADDDPLRLARDGDRAALAGDLAKAAASYAAALERAPAAWPRRADVLVSYIGALYRADRSGECVDLALAIGPETGNAASAADFLSYAAACAGELPEGDARRAQLTARAIERLARLVDDASAPLSADDRGDAMRILRELLDEAGDKDAARAMAERQRALLDDAAARAESAYEASTYNWPRAEVYVYLGVAAELVPALEASEKALPNIYDPPYRLAWVQEQLGNHDAALAAAERALKLAYGPRKARVQSLIATIHRARGDAAAELAARKATVELYEALPPGQKQAGAERRARDDLAKLQAE